MNAIKDAVAECVGDEDFDCKSESCHIVAHASLSSQDRPARTIINPLDEVANNL